MKLLLNHSRTTWAVVLLLILVGSMFVIVSLTSLTTSSNHSATINFPKGGMTANNQWTPVTQQLNSVDMVEVPAGCFIMGTDSTTDLPTPICFDAAFWIDEYDVTQAQFKRFSGQAAKSSFFAGDNRPVDQISWVEAHNYCLKRGMRLPTEAEWEYAARGPDSLVYPWGNSFDATKAVWNRTDGQGTADVGSTPAGRSWVGALDMSGNVWQWTSSLFKPYPYDKNDGRESEINSGNVEAMPRRTLRGGSWRNDEPVSLSTAARVGGVPFSGANFYGFRCARSQ